MGTWNNTQVAIKVMKTEGGVMPSSTVRRLGTSCGEC
jgi:hypothetical protein